MQATRESRGGRVESPFDVVACERCGRAVARAGTRRLFWIRVCLECDATLCDERPDDARGAAGARALGRTVVPALAVLAVGVVARTGGSAMASLVAGALAAEVLFWAATAFLRVPLGRRAFAVALAARVGALTLALVPGLAGLPPAGRLDLAVVGFFLVLFCRAAWFGCWWRDLLDEPAEDGAEFERALPLGRPGSPVAPDPRRR